MKKIDKSSWPVLIVSDQLGQKNDSGFWLDCIVERLHADQNCSTILSSSYNDACDIVKSREDLGTILVDWDLKKIGDNTSRKNLLFLNRNNPDASDPQTGLADALIELIRKYNKNIPILLITVQTSVEDIPNKILSQINGVIWKFTDTPEFLSGRIERSVIEYSCEVIPPFFEELIDYVNEYKYAWHTPGHMGGQGFLRSPSGIALHKFFGEDVLRADLSISVPELGSLLDHSGLVGEAERFSAGVFGADETYYVLNGTSTVNQIIWRSQVYSNERTLVDRNCHKSLNYAMVITDAKPDYMIPLRNKMGIIGPVNFRKIPNDTKDFYKMSALTNSTYDGVCYDVAEISKSLDCARNWHFDEAWYAYAKFHPMYKDHFAMDLKQQNNKLIFASQSTHKLLTAFSQASMLHIKVSEHVNKNELDMFKTRFNESYMMHGSTSPQYNMIASLEVASKMMSDNGEIVFDDIIRESIELRRKIASIKKEQDIQKELEPDRKKKSKYWFFDLWQPESIGETENIDDLMFQNKWIIEPSGKKWHGFNVLDSFAMLDPIKLTFTCPGFDAENGLKKGSFGIPAAIVTNYLIDKGIVCEKTDYYSWLLLNSIGTTKGKQGTLIAELFKFKELYDSGALLSTVFPELVKKYPSYYENKTLKNQLVVLLLEIHCKVVFIHRVKLGICIPCLIKMPVPGTIQ
ncbi:MAG TPA: Orn/Lys/Arg decarboxylase N-terminal domain-containing protein, partial [Clostridia bacterium]|nr:Orn/Lys/Arg decarboxylase N-terminal domain-containing protein [Clostridia bacterium]